MSTEQQKQMTPVDAALIIADSVSGVLQKAFGEREEAAMVVLRATLKTGRPNVAQLCGILASEVRRLREENANLQLKISSLEQPEDTNNEQ